MESTVGYLERNIQRHLDFFARNEPGDLLVYANVPHTRKKGAPKGPSIEWPNPLSDEFIDAHAYDLGVQAVRDALSMARLQQQTIDDDFCPFLMNRWGAAFPAAIFTGVGIRWLEGPGRVTTGYAASDQIKRWEDVPGAFNLDNKWVEYALEFWRGVESQDIAGLVVTPMFYRTPLDLANGLRGNQLFTDLIDSPREVGSLLDLCAEYTLRLDRLFRSEIAVLREAMGGALGAAMAPRTMLFNGDPIDMMSATMAERYEHPRMEQLTEYAGATLLHHHSLGVSRAVSVTKIKGLTLQEIQQDPNGPALSGVISNEMIEASLRVPILLEWDSVYFGKADTEESLDALLDRVRLGRFILHFVFPDPEKCRQFVEAVRKASSFS